MPQDQADLTSRLRQPPTISERRVLYSDGSMVRLEFKECDVAFGHSGQASSSKAELTGLLAAIMAVPPRQDILVRLVNKGVVTQL